MEKKLSINISSATLHIIAMIFMLFDHTWASIFPSQVWMTCLGRIAFPIFAFLIVEGYFYTHSLKNYLLRLFAFAAISEVPFDYMYGGIPFYPYHQNVLWTFILGLFGIWLIEQIRKRGKLVLTILLSILIVIITSLIALLFMLDYYETGILMIFTFYFLRGRKWWNYVGQFIIMYYINMELMGGFYYPVTIFGHYFEILRQGFALLALIPIWLYQGKLGYHKKWFKYFCYSFYPLHTAVLAIIALNI